MNGWFPGTLCSFVYSKHRGETPSISLLSIRAVATKAKMIPVLSELIARWGSWDRGLRPEQQNFRW